MLIYCQAASPPLLSKKCAKALESSTDRSGGLVFSHLIRICLSTHSVEREPDWGEGLCEMTQSGTRVLSDEALRLVANRFKALSEPTRLKLIMSLREGERNVGELVQTTGSTQANVSRQLQTLTQAGILGRRKDGLKVYYSIADRGVFDLCEVVCGSLQSHFEKRAKALR